MSRARRDLSIPYKKKKCPILTPRSRCRGDGKTRFLAYDAVQVGALWSPPSPSSRPREPPRAAESAARGAGKGGDKQLGDARGGGTMPLTFPMLTFVSAARRESSRSKRRRCRAVEDHDARRVDVDDLRATRTGRRPVGDRLPTLLVVIQPTRERGASPFWQQKSAGAPGKCSGRSAYR